MSADTRRGMALGALGVLMFAMTLPMTRLAVGDQSAPQLEPGFVTAGRAAGAGLLSAAWLAWHRVAPPARRHWGALALSGLGFYYAADEELLPWLRWSHVALGLLLPVALALHVARGRRVSRP